MGGAHDEGPVETGVAKANSVGRELGERGGGSAVTTAALSLQRLAGNRAMVSLLAGNQVRDVVGQGGDPLDPGTRQKMESHLGHDFADVRVHADAAASRSASAVNARAYTVGSDIALGAGHPALTTSAGQRTLAHELTHVVQQRTGVVTGTPTGDGLTISDPSDRYEREAEDVADRVARETPSRAGATVESAAAPTPQRSPSSSASATMPLQRAYELSTAPKTDFSFTGDHRAHTATAHNLKGRPLDAAANPPTVATFGWDQLWAAGHTLANRSATSSHYNAVRMHLINGRLGGPGNDSRNLAPGPAKVNSMMSAGPEIGAKLLADAGHAVWVSTTVKYHGNSKNGNELTSVVPYRIDMEYGVEGKSGTRWGTDIELPVKPLEGAKAKRYEDWASGKGASLVKDLQDKTNQVRAQVFELVRHSDLKFAVVQAFPDVYFAMEPSTQGHILTDLHAGGHLPGFLKAVGLTSSPNLFIEHVIFPLAEVADSGLLQAQFVHAFANPAEQRAILVDYKWELIQHLGAIPEPLATTDHTIFSYYPAAAQAGLLSQMDEDTLSDFLDGTSSSGRKALFMTWSTVENPADTSPGGRAAFVNAQPTVPEAYQEEFEKAMKLHQSAANYLSNRPAARKTTLRKPGKPGTTKLKGITKPARRNRKMPARKGTH